MITGTVRLINRDKPDKTPTETAVYELVDKLSAELPDEVQPNILASALVSLLLRLGKSMAQAESRHNLAKCLHRAADLIDGVQ